MPLLRCRITPAGAGKTYTVKRKACGMKDHPRRCGENLFVPDGQEIADGSPPQVRGKLGLLKKSSSVKRITPAGAGKTLRHNRSDNTKKDHPRRCGENQSSDSADARRPGSPPQVRGKPVMPEAVTTAFRITPAGAGKTGSTKLTFPAF